MLGALAGVAAVVAAFVAVPMALSQLREQRRLHAIEVFIETVGEIAQTSAELAASLRAFPADVAGHERTGRLVNRLTFLIDVIVRCRRDAEEYVSSLDLQGICYELAVASEQAELVLDQYVSELMPTADSVRWSDSVKSDVVSWSWMLLLQFQKFPESTIAQGAAEGLMKRLRVLQARDEKTRQSTP